MKQLKVFHRIEEAKQCERTDNITTKKHPTFKVLPVGTGVEPKGAS